MENKTTMEKRNTFIQHAPYVYLARPEGQGSYYLFVAVRKQVNEEVAPELAIDGQAISYEDGMAAINLTVSLKVNPSDDEGGDFFLMRYELKPEEHSPSGFHPESSQIEVKVAVMEESNPEEQKVYTTALAYVDADAGPLPEGQADSEPAYNCPYVYLEEEAAAEETEEDPVNAKGFFYPYVLIAPKGYRLAGPKDRIIVTSPNNGVFESLLVLSKGDDVLSDGRFSPFVNPAELKVNTKGDSDSGLGEGNFAATVVCLENEAEAEVLRGLEPMELHQFLLKVEQAYALHSEQELPGSPPAPATTLRRAKTRNMSSRRKHPRSISPAV